MYKKHFKKVSLQNPAEMAGKAEQSIKKSSGSKKGQLRQLYYFTGKEVDAKELSLAIQSVPANHLEVWRELNILEVVLEKDSLVFQDASSVFEDPEDLSFLEAHGIKTMFSTDFAEEDEEAAFTVYKEILAAFGGLLCSDTEDFRPMWKLSAVGTLQRIR